MVDIKFDFLLPEGNVFIYLFIYLFLKATSSVGIPSVWGFYFEGLASKVFFSLC